MNKKDIFIGFIIGIFTSLIGSYLFITIFTQFDISTGIQTIKKNGYLGKVITLGSTLDLAVFAVLLKKDKELMAGGVILAVIVLALSTLLI
jgi:cellulose synthase/poly-beta-1,6-N-acetylglucosamine synthase-like glycosyltransferase